LGTDLTVRRAGDTLHAPGIFDNSASVANMLAVIRALNAADIRTSGDLVFIGTTQEELGLHGMTYWLDHNPPPDVLIAMDGGLGPISYGALGIHWTRYHFKSAGSHTNTSRGKPTPVKALADAVSRIYATLPPPLPNGAVINVGQIHGGEIFNGIPENLFFTTDLCSNDPAPRLLDRAIDGHVAAAANTEGVEWQGNRHQRTRWGPRRRAARAACTSARPNGN
jgi:acetylornithine deacetylase/succinyl-diaminopimelate desuccinylase-like protein